MQPGFPSVLGRLKSALLPLLLLALLLTVALQHARSQEASGDSYARANAQMADFEADQLPPEDLEAMAYTPCVAGMAGIYPCNNVDLAAFMPNATIGGTRAATVWGWTDPQTNKEYAIMGLSNGTSFVDVTVADAPIYVGRLPAAAANSNWRELKVANDHVYIVSEASGHGMQVFDLTRLRDVVTPPMIFTADAHYTQVGASHNVAVNEETGFVYIVGARFTGTTCSGGLHMVNAQDPDNPTFAGCFSADGYTHDVQCVNYRGPDVNYRGREICFASNEDTVTIVDVTNKAAPVQLSRTTYSGVGYTHQVWLTEDQRYGLMNDELDEQDFGHNSRTRIFDFTSLTAPVMTGFYDAPVPAIDHNLYNLGHYSYMSNYTSGLRIVNINNVATPSLSEAGYFDIYPANNNATFNGTWNNYPYFESGTVLVSGIQEGLFVLKPKTPPDYVLSVTDYELELCNPATTSTTIDLRALYGYTGSVTLGTQNVPAGLSASVSPSSVAVPGSATLTVTSSGSAPAYSVIRLTATDGTYSDVRYIGVRVNSCGPTATPTVTTVPPTITPTSVPPTITPTTVPPTMTLTPPPGGLKLYLPIVTR